MYPDLKGKRILVIGGARGIGRSIVLNAMKNGCKVGWSDLNDEAGAELAGILAADYPADSYFYQHADCTSEAETKALFDKAEKQFGGLDGLVTCAGFTCPKSFMEIDYAEWRKVVAINLDSVYLALHNGIPLMLKNGKGAIVLIGSAAIGNGGGGRADYVTAKAALEGFSKAMTKEFAPAGIRCNIVHPSLCETDLLTKRHPDPEKRKLLGEQVPLRRLGQPEDIAGATLWLLSDSASYVTAQSIYVDGGRTFCK